jgi:hypothetical protein
LAGAIAVDLLVVARQYGMMAEVFVICPQILQREIEMFVGLSQLELGNYSVGVYRSFDTKIVVCRIYWGYHP